LAIDTGLTYRSAGVDIDAGDRAVELMKEKVRVTHGPEVLEGLGGFGGLFALDTQTYPDPVLVSGTDGVGTKLRIAFLLDRHDTVGIDAVAMCVNDVLVQGARPLFFLDYLAVGSLVPEKVAAIVAGVAEGCRQAGCALIGGETAEMPGFYREGEYDLAGFTVGVVSRQGLLNGSGLLPGDVLIGLPSSGLHSNGYSLVRKICFERAGWDVHTELPALGRPLGEELLTPTRIYVRSVAPLLAKGLVKGMAHITGGGLTGNIPRMLPPGCGAYLEPGAWREPPVFGLLREAGGVAEEEMRRTFNLGIGMVLGTGEQQAGEALALLRRSGEDAGVIGRVVAGSGVRYAK